MIIIWKATSPTSFSAQFDGTDMTLSSDHEEKWRFTANGKPVKGWWMTAKGAMQAAELIAQRTLNAHRATNPVVVRPASNSSMRLITDKRDERHPLFKRPSYKKAGA